MNRRNWIMMVCGTIAIVISMSCSRGGIRKKWVRIRAEAADSSNSGLAVTQSPDSLHPDEQALAPLMHRGDAFVASGSTVFRGATSGLIVGEFDKGTSKWKEWSHLALPGAVTDIVVQRNVAYVACGPSGVAVVDITDPTAPSHRATIQTAGAALRLDVEKDTLVIADGAMGLVVADIKSPLAPEITSLWASSGYVRDVHIRKRQIFIAEDRAGVSLLKLKRTGDISIQWKHQTGAQARSIFLAPNDILYVADGPGGILVLDVSKRKKPSELGRLELSDMARDVIARPKDNRLFVANGDEGVVVIDATDPKKMSVTGRFVPKHPANRVYAIGDQLFVGNDASGLRLMDIEDPDHPADR